MEFAVPCLDTSGRPAHVMPKMRFAADLRSESGT